MGEYILRFGAADFENTVFDIPRLSAIRGASFAYLYSPKLVDCVLNDHPGVVPSEIYTGGSQGAWRLNGSQNDVRAVAKAVREALRNDCDTTGPHSQLSYVVSLIEGNDSKALAAAESLNSLEKRQGYGFPLPAIRIGTRKYDEKGDRVRPADTPVSWAGEEGRTYISLAHDKRRSFGRDQRARFYFDYAGQKPHYEFIDDFETMVEGPPDVADSLKNKTAVFFADADGLNSKRIKAAREGFPVLSKFSNSLKARQRNLLANILGWLQNGADDGKRQAEFCVNGKLRFETLMWGGDEMLFVMPSWLALEFAQRFFEWTSDWNIDGDPDPITFSCGLVVANHKTPIRQMKRIAVEDLANGIKQLKKAGKIGKGRNALQAEIFESLSLPDTGFSNYRKQLYFHGRTPNDDDMEKLNMALTIGGDRFTGMCDSISKLKMPESSKAFPRSQLYAMIRKASDHGIQFNTIEEGDLEAISHFLLWKSRAGSDFKLELDDLRIIDQVASRKTPLLLSLGLIATLWDYVDPIRTGTGSTNDV